MRAHSSGKSGSGASSIRYCSNVLVTMLTEMRRLLSTPGTTCHQSAPYNTTDKTKKRKKRREEKRREEKRREEKRREEKKKKGKEQERKEKKKKGKEQERRDYTFERQFSENPCINWAA